MKEEIYGLEIWSKYRMKKLKELEETISVQVPEDCCFLCKH